MAGRRGPLCAVGALLAALLALAPAGPAEAQPAAPEGPGGAISVEDSTVSDAAVARRIRSIFAELEAMRGLQVSVDSGVVILSGEVLDPQTAVEAVRIAGRVQGVATVVNGIAVGTSVSERVRPVAERLAERARNLVNVAPLLAIAALVFALFAFAGGRLARMS